MSEVGIGTLYDMNKSIMQQQSPLSEEALNEALNVVDKYFYDNKQYFMLLCHERRDYTLFNITNKIRRPSIDLKECLQNRGVILSIEKNNDGVIEIWLLCDEELPFAYFLFPYDEGVITV